MAEQQLFLPLTVILETGWVLASRYQLSREQVADAMRALIALDRIEVACPELVSWAIEPFRAGADWADMIHLVAASKLPGFITLERRLTRDAGEHAPILVSTLA